MLLRLYWYKREKYSEKSHETKPSDKSKNTRDEVTKETLPSEAEQGKGYAQSQQSLVTTSNL